MITEKRSLPVGIELNGERHRELEIEPRRVAHMVDALDDRRTQTNSTYYEVCMLACQITKLGTIPKKDITGDLLLSMYASDFDVLMEAAKAALDRVEGFYSREEGNKP